MLRRRSPSPEPPPLQGDGPSETAPTRQEEDPEQLVWEARVREAAERLAFHLHYQPVMSLRDGRPVAFEALLRWDSEVGRVPPARFVAILEDTGLIVPVGRSVLEGACQQARRWQDEHPGSTDWVVAVNVSPRQLTEPGFGYSVKEALAVAGLRPDRLCLEITGSSALLDPAAVWGELRQLKVLGTRIAIDDFGTIHSSLSQLKSFPVDALKIDGSFVAGIGQGAEDEAIVAAIINLAHALGIETVAEGVETPEQLAFLRQLGCDSAQGYLFGRPGPPEALTGFFEAGTAEQLLVPTVLKRPDQRHAVA